jgi:hypothetical protein
MKMKEYYRELYKHWFAQDWDIPQPEQGDYEEDKPQAPTDQSEPPKKESEV